MFVCWNANRQRKKQPFLRFARMEMQQPVPWFVTVA
jgi:hypothetical protein